MAENEQEMKVEKTSETEEELMAQIEKFKSALSKANSEAADFKRQLREKQSAEEIAKAEQAERDRERDLLIETLTREKTENEYKSRLLEIGMTADAADRAVKTMPNGINKDFFDALAAFKSDFEKQIRADVIKGTPRPDAGQNVINEMTEKEFADLPYAKKLEIFNQNRELYDKLKGGN